MLSAVVLQVKVEQMALELRLTPLTVLLRSVLDQLQDKDPARIFAQPVSLKEVGVHTARVLLPSVRLDQAERLLSVPTFSFYLTQFLSHTGYIHCQMSDVR